MYKNDTTQNHLFLISQTYGSLLGGSHRGVFAPQGFVLAVNGNLKRRGVPSFFIVSLYKRI